MKRIFAGFVAIAMVLTLVGSTVAPAQAATVEELQAMIAQLTAQLASLMGGSSSTSGYMFTTDLTVGSTGQAVTELQKVLVSKGYLVMPAGVAMGYFGNLTKNAVAAWQAASGITPAAGYVGPKSRAALNAMVVTTPTPSVPGSTTGITTPGVEGTLTVDLNPSPASGVKVYEGDSKAAAVGIELEAKLSDIKIERIKVQLPNASFYNKIANRIYIADNGNVVGSADLNSSTVVKEGSNYFITVSGLNFIVPKDATKVLTVHFDLYGSIDSGDIGNKVITIPVDGVRGIDGAGVNQYGPSSAFSRTIAVTADLADSAALQLSLNSGTPQSGEAVASQGSSENELDGLHLLTFDLKAEDDDILVTDFTASIQKTGTGAATATTAYLYDGSTLVGSATVNSTSGFAVFDDIDFTVSKDSTKSLMVKVDIDSANGTAAVFTASASSTSAVAEASDGDTVTPTGSATGEAMTIRNVGPQFTLVSKTIEKSATASQSNTSTSTAKGIFAVKVKALGGDLTFGTQASGTASSTFTFGTYKGSANTTLLVASTSSYTIPSSGVVTSGVGAASFKLQENNEVTLTVEFLFEGRTVLGSLVSTDTYAIGIESIRWSTNDGATMQSSTFMAGETDWRTSGVSLP